ncbi:EF2563 family selenium-dependent molybdenum hydroxylase system protein [Eubacteriales bacterium OttesenSCG-928-K08]|nr:EF2563 family selenium-dependent molybdenum hydroxylase system protein [Eubacteriales bacterium OttesenSCG-928-K08]
MNILETGKLVVVRGGGDLATGVIQKLHRVGFKLLVLEVEQPLAIRRSVAICEAMYDGFANVEDIAARRISDLDEISACFAAGQVPVFADPKGDAIFKLSPIAVVDAILAKRNINTHKGMAPITIALGPGFSAPQDVSAVIETKRGHDLGRLILNGGALPNTGIPGEIGGKSAERVLHAPAAGLIKHIRKIGDIVEKDEPIFQVGQTIVHAPFCGLIRGLIREGIAVQKGLKLADVDPRTDVDVNTISDKARCLGGAVLEALLHLGRDL